MIELPHPFVEKLSAHFGARAQRILRQHDEITLEVLPADYKSVMTELRDHSDFAFEQLIDLCGIDYLGYGEAEWDTVIETKEFGRKSKAEALGRIVTHTAYHAGQIGMILKHGA